MLTRAQKEEAVAQAEWPDEGETRNINCVACSDTKQRLGIKGTKNAYIYNCFNCSANGYLRREYSHGVSKNALDTEGSEANGRASATASREPEHYSNTNRSADAVLRRARETTTALPSKARGWLAKYRIRPECAQRHALTWDPIVQRVILPVYREGVMIGAQGRTLEPVTERNPKYMTYKMPGKSLWCVLQGDTEGTAAVCCTEDLLSGIRVQEVMPAAVLFCVSVSEEQLRALQAFDVVHIWLDNDNPEVRQAQRVLMQRLRALGTHAIIHRTEKDPKEYTTKEIREELYDRPRRERDPVA